MSTEMASGQPEGQSLPAAEQQNVTGTENPEQQQSKTFTQAELDAIVQRRAAKAERKAQAQIEQIRQEMAALKEPKSAESKSQDPEPNRKDFDSYESFVEARAEWRAAERVKKELQAYESKSKEKETKAKQDESAKAFQKRVAAVIEKGQDAYPDFDSVINEAVEDDIIPIDSAMYHGVIDSDMAHELAYFLAKNPAEAKRILAMTPYGQARELGKLEDKLSAKKQPREGMETISGRNQSPSGLRDNLSDDAWIKARDKQVRASRS